MAKPIASDYSKSMKLTTRHETNRIHAKRSPSPTENKTRSETVIRRLKRLQALETLSFRLLGGWLPGIANWEIKHAVGPHLWQDAQHSREIRTRLWELRVMNPDREFDQEAHQIVQGLSCAQKDYEFLGGLYRVLKSELLHAYQNMMNKTHPIYDAPTVAILSRIVSEKESQIRWAEEALSTLVDTEEKKRELARWEEYLRDLIRSCHGVDLSVEDSSEELPVAPPGYSSLLPFSRAHRDERFKINIQGMDLPTDDDREAKVLFQFFNYAQEMQAAETLGSVLWEADGMEWEFYYDIARHCYDEERHSAMGDLRLQELGHHVTDFPNSISNYAWRQLIDPLKRYCVLTYVIEADSFKYKHQTYQDHLRNEDMESAEAVLYDIMDETMHVRMGQKWVPKLMEKYGYQEPLDKLVTECRELLVNHSTSPMQRKSANSVKKAT